MKKICVYCGSNNGIRPDYLQAAQSLGTVLAKNQIDIVYGGGKVGMMGQLANSALEAGGNVIGITPQIFIDMKTIHENLTDLHVVSSMHERKSMMEEISDGFITLPGGLGTFDELFEILTWAQLGIHEKPCGLLNTCGYFDKLLEFLDHCISEKYINPKHVEMLLVDSDAQSLLEKMRNYRPTHASKLLD